MRVAEGVAWARVAEEAAEAEDSAAVGVAVEVLAVAATAVADWEAKSAEWRTSRNRRFHHSLPRCS